MMHDQYYLALTKIGWIGQVQPSFRQHIWESDANRHAAGPLNLGETMFVGQIVANENGAASSKGRVCQQRFDGRAFVMSGRLELDYHLAFLHREIAPLLELRQEGKDLAGKLRTLAKVDRQRRVLVLKPDAVVSGSEGRNERPDLIHEAR